MTWHDSIDLFDWTFSLSKINTKLDSPWRDVNAFFINKFLQKLSWE